ncbi:PLDc N-terminal domain-containing protein [Candidatus Pacearchaeota archaeon]|nr:PLDc N-terminal domain-containing protein [Candidatus Pacearchaeota archaeon]
MTNNNNNTWIIILVVVVLALVFFGGYGMMGFSGGMMQGYYGFGWLFGIIALIAAIWVIYDVLVNNKKLSDGMKVLWVICAVFFSIITAVIYFLVGRNNQNDLFRGNRR